MDVAANFKAPSISAEFDSFSDQIRITLKEDDKYIVLSLGQTVPNTTKEYQNNLSVYELFQARLGQAIGDFKAMNRVELGLE